MSFCLTILEIRQAALSRSFNIEVNHSSMKFQILVALLVASILPSYSFAEDRNWPNWMGPRHAGISDEKVTSTDWPKSGLPIVWEKEIGIGFSSISIADGRLFTMGHIAGEEFVYCFDEKTGELIWSHHYPCDLVKNLHEGGPGATPTIDNDLVYTVGREGQLFCFEVKTGEIIWEKNLQDDLEVILPEWGFTSSAYVLNEDILLEAGRVVSYNKLTGEMNWQTTQHQAGYGSVAEFESDGKNLISSFDCDALRVINAETGEELDSVEWSSPFRTNSTTPIIHDDLIYISAGYNVGCGLFRWTGTKLEEVYRNRQMRNHFNNSILLDGYLYGFDGNSNLGRVVQLKCMNLKTGEVAWKQRGLGCGSLMIADGKLLALTEKGDLVLAKAAPTQYEELARSSFLDGRCWTVPVFLNGRIYGRNAAGTLKAVSLPK